MNILQRENRVKTWSGFISQEYTLQNKIVWLKHNNPRNQTYSLYLAGKIKLHEWLEVDDKWRKDSIDIFNRFNSMNKLIWWFYYRCITPRIYR